MKNIEKVLNNPIVDQKTVDEAKKELQKIKMKLAFFDYLVDNWSGYETMWQSFKEYYRAYIDD